MSVDGSPGMNHSGSAFSMDKDSMPSDKAEAARMKAAEVMAALKEGEPGDADAIMGKYQQQKVSGEHVDEQPPPTYAKKVPGMANSASNSSWNTSGFAFAPNTNAMDANTMPSDKAAAARMKAAEVMAALKKGEQGDADAIMGKQQQKGTQGILPLQWLMRKISSNSKSSTSGDSATVR
ncbi:hypothetical protein LTR36_002691 [Oleoguttula mirabilis]|uniref:SMP domain-containing protein n=1 Tax=Oleoguttula mirabilis TaxID=1507867 RepID=A0AAV9JKA3_9PEZI|nr:hypothetical protein LTR36_002691 [Oleoguttula mirabilis]